MFKPITLIKGKETQRQQQIKYRKNFISVYVVKIVVTFNNVKSRLCEL